jgi:hypothetical protein
MPVLASVCIYHDGIILRHIVLIGAPITVISVHADKIIALQNDKSRIDILLNCTPHAICALI